MSNGWLASAGTDPRRQAREIARAHEAFLSTGTLGPAAARVRDVVASSWQRSSAAQVDPDRDPPVELESDDLSGYRAAHPLAAVVPVLRDLVGGVADDGRHVWAVMDDGGRLLWVEGHHGARNRAARMNFVEGALWDEAHAGTNAPGTALALDHEVQIFAAEHFRHTVQDWTCAAAPIHDPATGRILGVLDVTGGDVVAHPHSLGLVRAAAQVAEAQLAAWHRAEPAAAWPRAGPAAAWHRAGPAALWQPAGAAPVRLHVLGRPDGALELDGRTIPLHRRHAELMLILAAHPEGMTGQQLAAAMYGDDTAHTTLRVELVRLRRLVGPLLLSRPYRLAGPVATDLLDVTAALERGDVAAAVRAYAGPVLPTSDAPEVVERRRWLEIELRSAVLAGTDPAALYAWASGAGFDDLAVWEHVARTTPRAPERHAAIARVRQLRREYGLNGDATLT